MQEEIKEPAKMEKAARKNGRSTGSQTAGRTGVAMFTGLVEEIGQIKKVDRTGSSCRLTIACHKVLEGTKEGDSIAVNGTCLTVTAFDGSTFSCDVTPETMRVLPFPCLPRGRL